MQNYKNHARTYGPHQYVFGPVTLVLAIFSFYKFGTTLRTQSDLSWLWFTAGVILILILLLSVMMRVHYALTLQNRIILLEMDFRYYRLTGKTLHESGLDLTDPQIYALRFASDEELEDLAAQAHAKNLKPNQIKKMIQSWQGDYRRV